MAEEPSQTIAIYDLDRTVTRLPTYTAFLIHAAWAMNPARFLFAPLIPLAMAGHGLRLIGRDRLKTWMWALLLGRAHGGGLDGAIRAFAGRTLHGNIRGGARRQIAADRARGARLVLATAAHELYALPIATELGFVAVIGTRAVIDPQGRVGPQLSEPNVYAGAKLEAVLAWLQREGISRAAATVRFYSDSSSDLPLLEWADEAVAVNPSRRLARIARARGWPIENWGAASKESLSG